MLIRPLAIVPLTIAMAFSGPAWSYDAALAESYATLFASVKGAEVAEALHMMKPDDFLNKVKAKEPLVVIDVRTPAETDVFTATLPDTLVIPVNELFSEANLTRIPVDRTVVVLCKLGARAILAGTALRHIGFENVYILKGGFSALIGYLGPMEANTPLKSDTAKK